jgi:L-ascorbate metabolism protein UlaG (beta-lactamase superfamily)
MKRRKFIKKSFWYTLGIILFPSLFHDSKADSRKSILNFTPSPENWKDDNITLSWLGHSSILINFYGTWILTDPALLERIGLYLFGSSIGPSRITPPALTVEQIPQPDIILLSHAHMDHMDYPTLKKITDRFPGKIDVITAYLTADVIADLPWKSITVLDWKEEKVIDNLRIKAFEVEHFGWRYPWEKDRSRGYFKDGRSYNAYLLEKNGKTILFGGDTRMTEKLNQINKKVDIALMPIGAYNPWKHAHCNPEEALQMADEIGTKYFIPMHCKTFQQGNESFEEPINWLIKSSKKYNLKIGLTEIGDTFSLDKII